MSEFNIRSDSINVEQIMDQIRSRIRDKRDVDYTEDQIRELAGVKLERFLDPKNVRSDLLEHYRKRGDDPGPDIAHCPPPPVPTAYDVNPDVIYQSSRGAAGRVLYAIRRLLKPILKLFFNPTPILHALAVQKEQIDRMVDIHVELVERFERIAAKMTARAELDALTYEVLNNLVVEMTRLSIDVKNHKMRVESVAARLDFDERRARALEQVVQYRSASRGDGAAPPDRTGDDTTDGGQERRRRRRRRGRRRPAGNGGGDAKTASGDVTPADEAPAAAGEAPAAPAADTASDDSAAAPGGSRPDTSES